MIRVAGRLLNPKKQLKFAITPVKGIGKSNVLSLLQKVYERASAEKLLPEKAKDYKLFSNLDLGELDEKVLVIIRNEIESNYLIEEDLYRQQKSHITRLVDLNSWRGNRHKSGLSVRGQRTRKNTRTRRRNRK
jgi:small subunit ribosomal protein S13